MFLIQQYEDGSRSVGFERYDEVFLKEPFFYRTVDKKVLKERPTGTKVTVLRTCADIVKSWHSSVGYRVLFEDETIERIPGYRLDGKHLKLSKKTPPKVWIIEWHEGAMWKHTRVMAWTSKEAYRKFAKSLECYGRNALELLKIKVNKPVTQKQFRTENKLNWISSIALGQHDEPLERPKLR